MMRKGLDDLVFRVREQAVKATIDALIEAGLLTDDLSAAGRGRGVLSGRLGSHPIDRELFTARVLKFLPRRPLSDLKPIRVIPELRPVSVSLDPDYWQPALDKDLR
jgi:hypothetical protein